MIDERTMNVRFQRWHALRALQKAGIDPDRVDVDAIIDPGLTLRENLYFFGRAVGRHL